MKKIHITSLLLFLFSIVSMQAQDPIMEKGLHLKGVLKKSSKIYLSPSSSGAESTVAERFTFVFLFKTDDGGRTKNSYYRVGKSPENADGWIHKDYIQLWSHRVCLNFTSMVGRRPSLVFRNYTDASSGGSYESLKSKAISMEPTSIKDPKEYDMLLPVLDEKRAGDSNQRNSKIYKIGYLAGTGTKAAKPVATRGKTRLDIMFVMDATGSMQTAINDAKKVVKQLTDHTRKMESTEIRYGVMSYRDRKDAYINKMHLPLTSNYRSVYDAIGRVKADQGGNEAEAMYEGVKAAINGTKWTTRNDMPSLRVIVLIGDARAHEYGEDGTIIHRDDLVDRASKKRVRFITIKILTGRVDNDTKHKAQLKALVQGVDDGDKGFFTEVTMAGGSSMTTDYMNKLKKSVENEIERMMLLEKIRSGSASLSDVVPSDRAIFLKNMPKSGAPSSGLHFRTGWIKENGPKGELQLEPYVFMTRDELNLYIWYMQTAIATGEASDGKKIAKTMADRVSAMTGIAYASDMDLEDHIQKKLALPKKHAGLLNFSLAELSTWSETRKKNMVKNVRTKRRALDDYLSDTSNWRKPAGSGFEYTFVPLSLLP